MLRPWLERWADEDAARQVGRRALRAALLTAAGIEAAPLPAAALSGAGTLAERIAALAAGPPAVIQALVRLPGCSATASRRRWRWRPASQLPSYPDIIGV